MENRASAIAPLDGHLHVIIFTKRGDDMRVKRNCEIWSERQDLNLRPLDPQSSALPGCATLRLRYIYTSPQ